MRPQQATAMPISRASRLSGALLLLGWALAGGCTNDYEDLAYAPETGPGGGPQGCSDDNDCTGDAACNDGVCTCFGGNACSQGETCCVPQGCVDLDDHRGHCGACRQACQGGMECNNGACGF